MVEVVEFKQLLEILLECFLGCFLVDVDKEREIVTQIVGVERMSLHEVVYDINCVIGVVEGFDYFQKLCEFVIALHAGQLTLLL